MTDLIGEYCEYHHNLNNISHDRRVKQLRVLRSLERSMPGPVSTVDASDIEQFMARMITDGYHPHTVVMSLRLIKPFLRWMRGRGGLIDVERWLRLLDVQGPRGAYDGKPRPYTPPEIRRFWAELDARYPWTRDREAHLRTPARGEYWVRRWASGQSKWIRVYPYARRLQVEAITALALYGGLRRDEIYTLDLISMHYENEYVRVASRKGADAIEKVRVVPMNEPMKTGIGNWLEFRAQVLAPEHDFPWLGLWGGVGATASSSATAPMGHRHFAGLLGAIGDGWEFHRLRHTFGTERYRAGMPIEILKETMGHATLRQTLGYARITEDRIITVSRATDAAFIKAVQNGRTIPNQEAA